ncbi:RNA-binding S4 domain-containing protein [Anaerococcus sp. Marseille-P3625]|uniref:RNA-binding S4 domain-containing protein n=1 Tax=Anaerococcus sp. Marseille-P3625 TaxID=1977277 RepID=UPI000C0719EE|nr:RNA-binding S4 domain-containing protein [Anaerococcus sp. Marseille-P3625]
MKKLEFETSMISLKDLLKATNLVSSGGLGKVIIKDQGVLVNGELCFVPGKKLYKNNQIIFEDYEITII